MTWKNHEIVAAFLSLYFVASACVPALRLPVGKTTWGYRPGRGFIKVSSNWTRLPPVTCLGFAMFCSAVALGNRITEAHSKQLVIASFNVMVLGFLCAFLLHVRRTLKELDNDLPIAKKTRFTRRERREMKRGAPGATRPSGE